MSGNNEIKEIKLSDDLVECDADISFSFESRGAIGTLTWTGKEFQFIGEVDESAKLFLDSLNRQFPERFIMKDKK